VSEDFDELEKRRQKMLNGYIEAARCIPLSNFIEAEEMIEKEEVDKMKFEKAFVAEKEDTKVFMGLSNDDIFICETHKDKSFCKKRKEKKAETVYEELKKQLKNEGFFISD
jgi:hypothetical protein